MTIKFSNIDTSKEPTYYVVDIKQLKNSGATSIQEVQLSLSERRLVSGIIGIKDGNKMDGVNDLFVLPCPPFCDPRKNGKKLITFSIALASFPNI